MSRLVTAELVINFLLLKSLRRITALYERTLVTGR